jgi:hypothetical protein
MGEIYEGTPHWETYIASFSELHTAHADEGPSFIDHLAHVLSRYANVISPFPDTLPPERSSVDHKGDLESGTVPLFKGVQDVGSRGEALRGSPVCGNGARSRRLT